MLRGTVLGPAVCPGQLLHERSDAGPSRERSQQDTITSFLHQPDTRPPGRNLGPVGEEDGTEELVWYDRTVIWSRGAEVFRQYTYDPEREDVAQAVFVWFKVGEERSAPSRKRKAGDGTAAETFGPFHRSQTENWGGPRKSSSSSADPPRFQRTLVVFLQTRAHVYFASGEDITIHLPFAIDGAWPISGGGMLVQRALEKRELRRLGKEKRAGNVLRGIDQNTTFVLDDVMDLDDDPDTTLPRLYALENPFDELRTVVQARVEGGVGRLTSPTQDIGSSSSILHITSDPYPFVIAYDTHARDIIFYRHTRIPHSDQPSTMATPAAIPGAIHPEEELRLPDPPAPVQPPARAPRPSLHRNASSFGPTADRRLSGAADPLDRTQRRAPRMSRGMAQEAPVPTDELQAALEPAPKVPPPTTTKGRTRGLSIISAAGANGVGEVNRRISGAASSFMLHEVGGPHPKMALHVAAEKDLRETTMMMGLERDESGARSDIVLDRVFSWKTPFAVEPEHIDLFVSDNLSPASVTINIHLAHPKHSAQLYPFRCQLRSVPSSRFVITPSPSIECLSAVPVLSTRHDILDILLLSRNGNLNVLTSGGRTIRFDIPRSPNDQRDEVARQLQSMAVHPRQHRPERRITKLFDAVGSQFTAEYDDGERIRLSADMRIRHPLARRCIEALSYVLPAQELFVFKREILAVIQQLPSVQRHDGSAVWSAFSTTLRSMLRLETRSGSLSGIDAVLQDSENSVDSITRRLAARVRSQRPHRLSPASDLSFGETLRPENSASVMLALHLIAQDLRLSTTRRQELGDVVRLVSDLASKLGRWDWKDYWARLLPGAISQVAPGGDSYDTSILDKFDEPPDILTYLSRQTLVPTKPFPAPQSLSGQTSEFGTPQPCKQTRLVSDIYARLGDCRPHTQSRASALAQRASATVRYIVEMGLDADWLADLPHGIGLPVLEMIRICQYSPDREWSPAVYDFIGRTDLAMQARGGEVKSRDAQAVLESDHDPTIAELMSDSAETDKAVEPSMPHVRFGSDRRLQEVERIMQTAKVRTIAVHDPKGASDHDILRNQQNVVNVIANRTLSIPVGQGMFEYGTRSTTITDIWEIPLIELSVKVSPSNTVLKAEIAPDSAEWPCFHNGVAAGLSISPDCEGIDSSWIVFNRPDVLNPEHGGFLLGLGLTGHLRSLMTYHAFPLMEPRHDYTSVGLLLGLACAYAGSQDLLITKVLSLHTHALLPLGSMELNASPIIQSSALVGLGLVYAGSRNLRMAEVALNEVGRHEMPNVDGFADYRESYSFSAAMAFGLIMLGRGGKTTSEVDRRMLAQLRRCIVGSFPAVGEKRRSEPAIDHNLTGPGATMTLGLMYLKTGRKDIADMLEIPQTPYDLDQVRPDLLLLRTFSRSLIMWEEMSPTMGWIEDQLPPFIQAANKGNKQTVELETELAYLHIVAGACFAIGLKYAGTAAELAHSNLMAFFGVLSKAASGQSMTYEGKIRRTAARQCLNVVTISLSLVMSGTGELNVLRRLRISHGQEGAGVNYGSHLAMHSALGMLFLGKGHYTLGNSNLAIAAMSIAFFPRFLPSSADNKAYPQAFRHLWALAVEPRCLVAKDVDTLETVYLPIKLRSREIDSAGTNVVRQQNLISPTLIAPFGTLLSIEVDSPRYWPIRYDLTVPCHRWNLVNTRTIYVKRKNGFLDYNSDPKGNRSIFVRAGSMTGIDLHYDLLSPASPPTISAEEVAALVRAHSGDMGLVGLARYFNSESSVHRFVRTTLIECVSLDKMSMVGVYLAMYAAYRSAIDGDRGTEDLVQSLFARRFYQPEIYDRHFSAAGAGGAGAGAAERRAALIRPSFLGTIIRRLGEPSSGPGSSLSGGLGGAEEKVIRQAYLRSGATIWQAAAAAGVRGSGAGGIEALSRWLVRNHVPPLPLLEALRDQARSSKKSQASVVELKVRDSAERYMETVAAAWDDESMEKVDGVGVGGQWNLTSLKDALGVWLE